MTTSMPSKNVRRGTVAADGSFFLGREKSYHDRGRRRSVNLVNDVVETAAQHTTMDRRGSAERILEKVFLPRSDESRNALATSIKKSRSMSADNYNFWTLSFTNPRREAVYSDQMAFRVRGVRQLTFLLSLFFIGFVYMLELSQPSNTNLGTIFATAYVIATVLVVALFSTSPRFVLNSSAANALCVLSMLIICSIETIPFWASRERYHMITDAHHPYRATLTVFAAYTVGAFSRMRFVYAVASVVLCAFVHIWVILARSSSESVFYYCVFFYVVSSSIFLMQMYQAEYVDRAVFLKIASVHAENESLVAEVKALRRVSTHNKSTVVAPIETITDMLSRIINDEALPDTVSSRLGAVVDMLTRNATLFKPDLEDQINHGRLKVDRDTKSWLLSEVTPKPKRARRWTGAGAPPAELASRQPSVAEVQEVADGGIKDNAEVVAHLYTFTNWNFDVFRLADLTGNAPLSHIFLACIEAHSIPQDLQLNVTSLRKFIARVERGYRTDIPYHTSTHAADVVHAVNHLISSPNLINRLSSIEKFSVLLAAAVHDYDHPGVNNSFLVRARDPLAILYNDQSPLENHHAADAYLLIGSSEFSLLNHLPRSDQDISRRLVIDLVLATDIARHFSLVSQFNARLSVKNLDLESPADMTLALQMIVKCADVSNPSKEMRLYNTWTERVMSEFYLQGDKERRLGLEVSAYMDRENPKVPKCQVNFINFICLPTYKAVGDFLERNDLVDQAIDNMDYWRDKEKEMESELAVISEESNIEESDYSGDFPTPD